MTTWEEGREGRGREGGEGEGRKGVSLELDGKNARRRSAGWRQEESRVGSRVTKEGGGRSAEGGMREKERKEENELRRRRLTFPSFELVSSSFLVPIPYLQRYSQPLCELSTEQQA